ncbi:MAG: peroxide stress protein YaaA [Verrucomicrobiales bacterium]|nr:peroxide stress protein YaaA [Verrucomicrobiales bacterium]
MLAVISPAKTLDYESALPAHNPTQPEFLDDSEELIGVLRKKTRPQLSDLMGISEKLADLNFQRYKDWSVPFDEDNARAALLAFKGDVYTGFTLETYGKRDFNFSQKHLRILSGLYGLLRPMDLMQPYRLEMGTKLKNPRGKDLYEFWGSRITEAVDAAVEESGSEYLINLASNEYFSSIRKGELKSTIITPGFKDLKNGKYKIVSFYAKKARGMMCDFMIKNRITNPEELKKFDTAGYRYNKELSDNVSWVFTRDEPPKA